MKWNKIRESVKILLIINGSFLLISCGGGNDSSLPPPPAEENPCIQNQLYTVTNICIDAVLIDVDGDTAKDGIDVSGNGIPEMVFVKPLGGLITGLDIDGDGSADYYLKRDENNKQSLYDNSNAIGKPVLVVVNDNSQVIGIDDGTNIDYRLRNILNDVELPKITVTPEGGSFSVANKVVISCSDDVACNAIAYTTDGVTTPNFSGDSTISIGKSAELLVGDNGDGIYTLKIIARDSSGKISAETTLVFTIGTNLCLVPPIASAGSDFELTIAPGTFTLDGAGSIVNNGQTAIYSWQQIIIGDEPDISGGVNMSVAKPRFAIPSNVTTLSFSLSVIDNAGCSSLVSDVVNVYVLENSTKALFVDGTNGSDVTGIGSREFPFLSISKALSSNTAFDIYVASIESGLSYELIKTLNIPTGVSLYGGYYSNWIRDVKRNKTKINGAVNAIEFSQVDENSWLSGFKIVSKSSTVAGEHVSAVTIKSGQARLVIQYNEIISGDAVLGSEVSTGSSYGIRSEGIANLGIYRNSISAGNGGAGLTVGGTTGLVGEAGSPGWFGNCSFLSVPGGTGGKSNQSSIANGFNGGDSAFRGDGQCGGFAGRSSSNSPGDGGNADPSCSYTIPLRANSAIFGGLSFGNNSVNNFYTVANGAVGAIGAVGLAGHGGGGGGNYLALDSEGSGGGGGGGGAGGNGGNAAPASLGGGGSFGIYLTQISPAIVEISDRNIINTKSGGTAGRGGYGGVGGLGGSGGPGGGACFTSDNLTTTGYGGRGSNGGIGGDAGDGSGAGGGPSVGIFVNSGLNPTIQSNTIILGNGGQGGYGRHGAPGSGGHVYGIYATDSTANLNAIVGNSIILGSAGIAGNIEIGGSSTVSATNGIVAEKN